MQLHGKTVLLTGAASGIGKALAMQLAQSGSDLVLIDRDQDGLRRVAEELQATGVLVHTWTCDLADPDQIDATLADLMESTDVMVCKVTTRRPSPSIKGSPFTSQLNSMKW